jgi:hypothetical protein
LRAWIATERGSRRAAASKEMCSGNLHVSGQPIALNIRS